MEQFAILETVSPLDFLEFRIALETSTGFESWQLRLLELKLGLAGVCLCRLHFAFALIVLHCPPNIQSAPIVESITRTVQYTYACTLCTCVQKDGTTQTESSQSVSSQANQQTDSKTNLKKSFREELDAEQRKLVEKAENEPSLSTLLQVRLG